MKPSKTSTLRLPVWLTPDGKPVSCLEKIKVLNENLEEIRSLAQDALEDAVIFGVVLAPENHEWLGSYLFQ